MAGSDLCGTIISTASKIQELGNNWYKASKSWNDFPGQVERLCRTNEFWQEKFANFGMSSDKAMTDALWEAALLLEEQEAKLLKRLKAEEATLLEKPVKGVNIANCFPGCWTMLSMTVFPAQVGDDIQTVISAFDNIRKLLTNEEEAAGALEKRELRRMFSLPFSKDDRYVPLVVSESAVRSALEDVNPGCPRVVLLHGAAGKGKSTLARAVALHYKEVADRTAVFENVVYLECGPQPDILTMQFKLLQLLGSGAAAPQEQARLLDSDSDLTIAQRLKGLLRDRKLLMIFDDVWEGGFLQIMVDLCGTRVKCLVTSQLGHLCRDLNCSPREIRIEDVQPEVAKTILASHVRLPHHQIPRHLEKIADTMIRETEGNPLALASIAAGIDYTRCDELDAWEAASNSLFEMLHSESPVFIQSKVYPRSYWSSMKLSIESLEKEAQNLLILAHMCDGLSLPEEVIDLLYGSTKGQWGSGAFARLRKELESRELIKITLISENPRKQRSWSIHSLQKQFIQEESTMNDAKESILTSLKGLFCTETESRAQQKVGRGLSVEEVEILSTLVGLYLNDERFSRRAVSKMTRDISPTVNNLRRSAIEPITRLLGFPPSDRWTEKLRTSAKKVFMMYICNAILDNEGICDLLGSPLSTLATIITIRDIATLEETTLLDEKSHGFMNALINFLQGEDNGTNAAIQMAAGEALGSLCWNNVRSVYILTKFPSVLEVVVKLLLTNSHNPQLRSLAGLILGHISFGGVVNDTSLKTIVQYPGALTCVVKSLHEVANPSLQSYAASILSNLACHDHATKLKIINFSGALEDLVKSLSKDSNPTLQERAARALANLAGGNDEIQWKIINSFGALEELVKSLSLDNNPGLQKQAARALVNLASGDGNPKKKIKIINSLGALEELVKSLSKDNNPRLQEHAARALANLASGDGEIRRKIINSIGALEELVKCLSKENNLGLQRHAAWALANLAIGDGEIKLKIIRSSGALEELLKSLSKNNNPSLQEHAAWTLANLAGGDTQVQWKIINSIGALEELVKCLSNDNNPSLQERVAQALANLAGGNGEIQRKIINFFGALEELVKSLSKDNNPHLQERAARALANLASGNGEIQWKIINSFGALEELVKSLSKDNNPSLQKQAARALVNLASGDGYPEKKFKIINSIGALEELVKSLSKDNNRGLQERAAGALANLVGGDGEIQWKVINSSGALEELVKSLSKDNNRGLQVHAAWALANLAAGEGEVKSKIMNSIGTVEELVKSLSKEDNPRLQEQASRALVNLGIGDGRRKSKIINLDGPLGHKLHGLG